MMQINKLKIIAGILAIFFLGAAVGGLGTHIYMKRRIENFFQKGPSDRFIGRVMKHMLDELDLTPEQRVSVENISKEMQADLVEFRRTHQPELEEIVESGLTRIKAVLTPEQQKKMAAIHERIKQKRTRFDPPPDRPLPDGFSPPEHPPSPPDPMHMLREMQENLGLTPEQTARIQPLFAEMAQREKSMRMRYKNSNPQDFQAMDNYRKQMEREMEKRLEVILTPEQMAEYRNFRGRPPRF